MENIISKLVMNLFSFFMKLPKEQVEDAIKKDLRIVDLIKQHLVNFSLFMLKTIIRMFWNEIESYITNPNKLLELIKQYRPDIYELLITEQGYKWFIKNLREVYDWLYDFTWKE